MATYWASQGWLPWGSTSLDGAFMTVVAVIQPYFIPYAGYFRLFAAADVVAIFDCVQFPRQGWVHRNVLPLASGRPAWLTLPLAKAPRGVRIVELQFAADAEGRFAAASRRFPVLESAREEDAELLRKLRGVGSAKVADYLCDLLQAANRRLNLTARIVRTSTFGIASDIRGQDRVIAVAERLGATCYVNPSGGRTLYDRTAFSARDIDLRFFAPWEGSSESVLTRLLRGDDDRISAEIDAQKGLLR